MVEPEKMQPREKKRSRCLPWRRIALAISSPFRVMKRWNFRSTSSFLRSLRLPVLTLIRRTTDVQTSGENRVETRDSIRRHCSMVSK